MHLESKDYYFSEYNATTGTAGRPCPDPGPKGWPDAYGDTPAMWPYCGMDLADSDTNDGTFQPWVRRIFDLFSHTLPSCTVIEG